MRRLSTKRLLQAASLALTVLTVLFGILWIVRGLGPAIDCGVMTALARGDWPAAYACVNLAEYDALLFVLGLGGAFLAWLLSRKASDKPIGEYDPTPAEHARNREAMRERVSKIWIEGNLDQALYQAVLIRLGMTWRAAVPRPGSLSLHRPGEQEQDIAPDTPIVRLFDNAQHKLLILGEPGSGKTTLMLDLARSLLQEARTDTTRLIPVILNLSSLTEPEQSLDDWLVSELGRNYVVPEKLARYWLAHDELALLLDGLDEVRADRRANVVEKLNRYPSDHHAPWLVICCRNNEYAELSAAGSPLEDVDAIVLQPLTRDQTENYLTGLDGPEPQRLWNALQTDTALLEVADTPLMLNVMLLAADQLDWDALPTPHTPIATRSFIYDAYIRNVLKRKHNTGRRYTPIKTLYWLHWLAGKMVKNNQSDFLLERMNRSWFNRPWQRFSWIPIFALIFAVPYGLVCGLLFWLVGGLTGWPTNGQIVELIGSLTGWPTNGLIVELIGWVIGWPTGGLILGLILGTLTGMLLGWGDINVQEQIRFKLNSSKLLGWSVFGLTVMLAGWLLFQLVIVQFDKLRVSTVVWRVIWMFRELIILLYGKRIVSVRFELLPLIFFGVLITLFLELDWLLSRSTKFEEDYGRSRPNAAIRESFRSGLIVGLTVGPILGLISVSFLLLIARPTIGIRLLTFTSLTAGLFPMLIGGLLLAVIFGWRTVIKHYSLRLVLFFDGSMPLDYVRFLDDCADHVLLRRVGGSYIFIHRTFMEHVASLDLAAWQTRLE